MKPIPLTIINVMEDPNVFGPWFQGVTWVAWKVFLMALFGLMMSPAELETYRKHTGRQHPPTAQASGGWLVVGRRGGKSLISALIAVFLACFREYSAVLAPGERGIVMVIAADRQQARVVFRYIAGLLDSVPMLARLIENKTKESITLTNRVTIEVHTASFRAVRGYTVIAAICDEIAFWPNEESANPDAEIIQALKPAMATIRGALLLGISSPYARRGELWRAYKDHYGIDGDPVLVWQADTKSMNAAIPQSVIDTAYSDDAAGARAEYGAEFRRNIEAFIAREAVEACVVFGRRELPPLSNVRYVGFVDPSGGSQDSMTLAIAHYEKGLAVLDAVRELIPPFSPEAVVKELAEFLATYRVTRVYGDRYAGEWPREQFRKYGIIYEVCEQSKSDLYREVLPAINSGSVALLDHQRLLTQFCGLERRTARGGRDSIDHASGSHDDLANAVAGVLVLAADSARGKAHIWLPSLGPEPAETQPDPDQRQLVSAFGLRFFERPSGELTCGSCTAFEDRTERCLTRNFKTKTGMVACDHYCARMVETT